MPEPAGEDRQISFTFEYDAGYRLVPVNGVWGGITPRGDLRLDFFVESMIIPSEVVNLVTTEGKLGQELRRTPEKKYVRKMQVGLLLSIDHAETIAEFIKTKIKDFRKNQEGK
jgi:hypothetical protein